MTEPSSETIHPSKINLDDYAITYSADQLYDLREKQAADAVNRVVLSLIHRDLPGAILGPEAMPELGIDADEEFPAHDPKHVSKYFDEITETYRLMVDSNAAIEYADLEEESKKAIATRSGFKRVLTFTPQNQCVLNKNGIKQGLKLEHVPEILERTNEEINQKHHKLEQEKQKVYKSEGEDIGRMQNEIEQLKAASELLVSVLTPPEDSKPEQRPA